MTDTHQLAATLGSSGAHIFTRHIPGAAASLHAGRCTYTQSDRPLHLHTFTGQASSHARFFQAILPTLLHARGTTTKTYGFFIVPLAARCSLPAAQWALAKTRGTSTSPLLAAIDVAREMAREGPLLVASDVARETAREGA